MGFIFVLMLLLFPRMGLAAEESNVSKDRSTWQAGVELGGPAFLYNVYGSFRPIPNLAFNLGIAPWGIDKYWIPGSVSLLIGESNHLFEVTAGGALAISATSVFGRRFSGSLFPNAGIGYRYWPKGGGFSFRAVLYLLSIGKLADTADNLTVPFPGISFGYSF